MISGPAVPNLQIICCKGQCYGAYLPLVRFVTAPGDLCRQARVHMYLGTTGACKKRLHMQDLVTQRIEKLEADVQQCQQKLQDVEIVRADLNATEKRLQLEKERIDGEREGILKQHKMQSTFKTKVATRVCSCSLTCRCSNCLNLLRGRHGSLPVS